MTSQSQAAKMTAKPNWNDIHPTIRQIMIDANISGIHGTISDASANGRFEIAFAYDNDGDECDHKFWFDADQISFS